MSTVVAHIVHWPKSGIGAVVRQLVQFNQAERLKYIVILLQSDSESAAQFARLGVPVVGASISRNPLTTLLNIRKQLRAVDVVHSHSFLPHLVGTFLARKHSRQIRTVHNPYPYFTATDIRSRVKRLIEGFVVTRSRSDLVAVSQDTERALPWPAPPGATATTIENGIAAGRALDAETAKTVPGKPPGFLFATLGRLEHQKGFDVLLDALARLNARQPASPVPVTVWIIGDGSLRQALEQQARSLQLSNVRFAGYQIAPAAWLAKADAFVLPSRFEGFSLAAAEALALDLPVILTDFGGIAALLKHGENAHIVPKENPEQLAEALFRFANDRDYRDRLARNGKAFVEAHFSMEECASKYAALYLRDR
jgi:glycosyltransferase involved in cell wall biosynthesis